MVQKGTKSKTKFANNYQGWPSKESRPPKQIDTIDASIQPKTFWKSYISQRKPALINGHPTDPEWKATDLWTVEYLHKRASEVPVRVEHRDNASASYGKGEATKVNMAFGDVLKRVAEGDTSLYMTTQEAAPGPDGHPEVMAPPTSNLMSDFPLQPALLGNLVPQQVNIWLGCAPEGSTTGLHLDFHDNLYVLMYGRKRFRLYPPSALPHLYVHGRATRIYPNGRVVFEAQGDVLADGSAARDVNVWKKKRAAEKELEAAEAAVARGEKGAKNRLEAAERALDAVLEAALDDELFGDFDDFDALEMNEAGIAAKPAPGTAGEPDSFSKIDLSLPESTLRAKYPDFPGVKAALEVEMNAGQSLYIPAGWFHEVTSYSDRSKGAPAFHLALNYWTHPPDVLDSSEAGYKQPYTTEYWPELWEARKARYSQQITKQAEDGGAQKEKKSKRKRNVVEEAEHDHGHDGPCGHGCTHHHHHDNDDSDEDGEWRAPTVGERAHFLNGIRGMFGMGRRQHLVHFVGLKMKR